MNTAQKVLFNLNNLNGAATLTHKVAVITDDEGKPLAGFLIVGKNSPQFRAHQRELRSEALQRSAVRKEAADAKTVEGAAEVIEGVDSQNMRTACAVVTGWFGFCEDEAGKIEIPFDAKRIPSIFEEMPTWKDKVLADLEKEGNFMPSLSKG